MLYWDIIFIVLMIVLGIVQFFFADLEEKFPNSKWRMISFVPLLILLAVVTLAGGEPLMTGAYLASVMLFLCLDLKSRKKKRVISLVAAAVSALSFIPCLTLSSYRSPDYLADFESAFDNMQERYILAEYKGIDWNALYRKYKPIFKEAKANNNALANNIAWTRLCGEFHDGHVYFVPSNPIKSTEELLDEIAFATYGDDHGLVILSYSDGRCVAAETDESLGKLGIHNGTVITSWNGKTPEEAAKDSAAYDLKTYPEAGCEYFYRTQFAAGTGGENVEVKFIADDGTEQTAVLPVLGSYVDRYDKCMEKLDDGVKASNFDWTILNDTTACFRLRMMMFDTKSNFDMMEKEIREKVLELQSQGIKDVIIDLRNNGGGNAEIALTLSRLFGEKGEHLFCYDGVWDDETHSYKKTADGRFEVGTAAMVQCEDILGDGHLVVLVNADSASASDITSYFLHNNADGAVMGYTKSCCIAQGVGGVEISSGSVSMSMSLFLNEDGTPLIDSDKDGVSQIELDVQVPFDETALDSIFNKGEDYLMNKAAEYLESNKNH